MGQTVLSFTLGALVSIFATMVFEWLRRPTLTVQLAPPDDKNLGTSGLR
jgi:hypothetical protein